MDITPTIAEAKQLIQRYGNGGFRVTDTDYGQSVLVFPDRTELWPIYRIEALTLESLQPVIACRTEVDLLLIGCGRSQAFIPPALRDAMRAHGISLDVMDTGAACRTYNILLAEERRVAAALIAV